MAALTARPVGRAALSVGFVLLPNFTLTPFAAIIDVLRLAADEGDRSRPIGCRWTILGEPGQPVRSSCGAEVACWERAGDPARFDYVFVVGGLLQRSRQVDATLIPFLRRAEAAGVAVAGICTGTFLMAEAGLLAGRRCCVSWFHADDLLAEFPDIRLDASHLFVVDGRAITCAGGAGAIDLAAWLVAKHLGPARARKCLDILLVERARSPEAAQPLPASAGAGRDGPLGHAILHMERTLAETPCLAAVAEAAGVSRRQLERLFLAAFALTPGAFLRRLRLNRALWLLAGTDRGVTAVAAETGFSDAAHLSRLFKAAFGTTPSAARRAGFEGLAPLALGPGEGEGPPRAAGFIPGERRSYAM